MRGLSSHVAWAVTVGASGTSGSLGMYQADPPPPQTTHPNPLSLSLSQTSIFRPRQRKLVVVFRPPIKTNKESGRSLPARATSVHPESSSGVSKRPLRDHQRGLKRPLADHQRGL